MRGWLRSVFGRGRLLDGNRAKGNITRQKITLEDSEHIESALVELTNIGLKPRPGLEASLTEISNRIAASYQGMQLSQEPTLGHWLLMALSGDNSAFENSAHFDDHCYDGIDADGFAGIVTEIIHLTGNEWPIDFVTVEDAQGPGSPLRYGELVKVKIHESRDVAPFSLTNEKDFDWSVITRLNERLPQDVSGRFWMFHDGSATIVFLTPEDVSRLNELSNFQFVNE